jgi:BirA family biotin operon repressor/biotin-[acetyl-CoA-carboxylase] ligase
VVPGSPYTDLDRPPLTGTALRRALVVPGGLWTSFELKTETGSTNADVVAAARAGAAEGLVVLAERQTAGRGRLGRVWQSPPRAGLAVSVLLRPGVARARSERSEPRSRERDAGAADPAPEWPAPEWAAAPTWRHGWLPLLAGLAVIDSITRVARLDASLKWPNDVLVQDRKCAGILAEVVPGVGGVVVGIGLNVTVRAAELPSPEATSLALAGAASTDRDPLVRELLRALARRYERWRDATGDAEASGLRRAYLENCRTLGQDVRVTLPGGEELVGEAATVDDAGRLVVVDLDGVRHVVSAGDVLHLRPNFDS